jgi:hypothetical protein
MATLFLDFEGGNDQHAGTSFATLADGTDGRISSTTFSSAGANFPNDGSLIGQYLSIFNGTIYAVYNITAWVSATSLTIAAISGGSALANQAVDRQYYIGGRWKNITTGATAVRTIPGDTIRIMGSPAPTSLGQNGVWTSQALQATKTLTAATNATPIAITITGHGYSTGDTVVVTGVVGNTAANGTWEITVTDANTFTLDGSAGNGARTSGGTVRLRNNTRVMLASAVTANIASTGPGRAAWTASANVTATLSTATFKEHSRQDRINVATAFTTGKAAYYTLPSALDLSGYQQVSFWLASQAAVIAAGQIDIRLCSDTTGDIAVNIVDIPAIPSLGRFQPITVDTGNALGSNIQSIALYVNSDLSTTQTAAIDLNNIIACKASSEPDSLTLTSLIGKNVEGETFWGIQSINGTRVMLDADTNAQPTSTSVRGYYGTSETVTTWKRETIKLGPAAAATTALQTIQESGTDGNPITYSGGWDRTDMSTQNLETWLDGQNGNGYAITSTGRSFVTCSNIGAVRLNIAFSHAGTNGIAANFQDVYGSNLAVGLFSIGIVRGSISSVKGHAACLSDISLPNSFGELTIDGPIIGSGGSGIIVLSGDTLIKGTANALLANNGTYGITSNSAGAKITNIRTEANETAGIGQGVAGSIYLLNCNIGETTEVSLSGSGSGLGLTQSIPSHNHDQTAGNHKIFMNGALISAAADQRKTASGISWKIQPTSSNRVSASPVLLSLAKVACAANSLVTVKAWMRRSNTDLTMRLVCKGGQIAGVDTDVVDAMTAAADTWAEQTITFTPTEVGVVEITAEAWGGTTFSGWVDDMTISQA